MLAVTEAHGISDWLLDVRRRDKVSPELSAWVSKDFCPQATRRLPRAGCAWPCSIRRPSPKPTCRTPTRKKYVDYVLDPARPFDIGLFDDEGAAMRWLCPTIGA